MYRIRGTLLPEGQQRDVFVVDGRFTFEAVDEARTLLDDAILLPGLVDAHAHLAMASPAPSGATPREAAEASARTQLDAGVLLIREPGGPTRDSSGIGPAQGLPRVVTAGRFLAPPGRYFPGLAREVDEEGLPDAVVEECRASGGAWAKVIGDSPFPGPGITRTFSAEALREAAARVHAIGGKIAIHGMIPDVIQDAIDAGFDTLEHGSHLAPDQLASAAVADVTWVPTRSIEEDVRGMVRSFGWPDDQVASVDEGLQAAADAGIRILAGTDAGMGPHGMIWREVALLTEAGLTPEFALGSASWIARSFLGLPGIEEGAPADLVAYRDDPRTDLGVLASPDLVMLDGRLVRDPR
jgi:imidazolonepropionase-like amidohydrolase